MQMISLQAGEMPAEIAVASSLVELVTGLIKLLTTDTMSTAARRRLQLIAQVWRIGHMPMVSSEIRVELVWHQVQ